MGTFTIYIFQIIAVILGSGLLVYMLWRGLILLSSKGLIKMNVKNWSRKKKILLGLISLIAITLVLYPPTVRSWMEKWGTTEIERNMTLPDDDFISNPKVVTNHAITIDAPPTEVWKWLVQVGGYRAGWYSLTWAENLFGMGVYNKYEIRPEWQNLELGPLCFNQLGDCWPVMDIEPGKYFVLHIDNRVDDSDWDSVFYASTGETVKLRMWKTFPDDDYLDLTSWILYIEELPDGKSRLISRMHKTWETDKPIQNFMIKLSGEEMHCIMDIEMLKQLKDCAEGNASKYKNTKLPEGGIH